LETQLLSQKNELKIQANQLELQKKMAVFFDAGTKFFTNATGQLDLVVVEHRGNDKDKKVFEEEENE
jgi:hypothetical protein